MPYKAVVDLKRHIWLSLRHHGAVHDESGYATRKVAEVSGLRYDKTEDQQRITAALKRLNDDGSIIRDMQGRRTYEVSPTDIVPEADKKREIWFHDDTWPAERPEDLTFGKESGPEEADEDVTDLSEPEPVEEVPADDEMDYDRLAAALLGRCIQVVNHESQARAQVDDLTERLRKTDQSRRQAEDQADRLRQQVQELQAVVHRRDEELEDARENVRVAEHNAEVWRKQLEEIESKSRGSSKVRELIGKDTLAKLNHFAQEQQHKAQE